MKTIVFNECCIGWSKVPEQNAMYLGLQKDYLNDLLMHRGYLYLNDVYEALGVQWDPDDENVCYRAEYGPIGIELESIGRGNYLVKID